LTLITLGTEYVPAATSMVSPGLAALIASCIVPYDDGTESTAPEAKPTQQQRIAAAAIQFLMEFRLVMSYSFLLAGVRTHAFHNDWFVRAGGSEARWPLVRWLFDAGKQPTAGNVLVTEPRTPSKGQRRRHESVARTSVAGLCSSRDAFV
jgi:hypothetical protein